MNANRKNLSSSLTIATLPATEQDNAPGLLFAIKLLPVELAGVGISANDTVINSFAAWQLLEAAPDTLNYIVNKSQNENGALYTIAIQGSLPKNRPELIDWFEQNTEKDFLILAKDRNGNVLLFGSKKQPLRLINQTHSAGQRVTRNVLDFSFVAETDEIRNYIDVSLWEKVDLMPSYEVMLYNELRAEQRFVTRYYIVTIETTGQTTFSINLPNPKCIVCLFVNGVFYFEYVHFSHLGNMFFWNGDFALDPTDTIAVVIIDYVENIITKEELNLTSILGKQGFLIEGNPKTIFAVNVNGLDYFKNESFYTLDNSLIWTENIELDSSDTIIARYFNSSLMKFSRRNIKIDYSGQTYFDIPDDCFSVLDIYLNYVCISTEIRVEETKFQYFGAVELTQTDILSINYLTKNKND